MGFCALKTTRTNQHNSEKLWCLVWKRLTVKDMQKNSVIFYPRYHKTASENVMMFYILRTEKSNPIVLCALSTKRPWTKMSPIITDIVVVNKHPIHVKGIYSGPGHFLGNTSNNMIPLVSFISLQLIKMPKNAWLI